MLLANSANVSPGPSEDAESSGKITFCTKAMLVLADVVPCPGRSPGTGGRAPALLEGPRRVKLGLTWQVLASHLQRRRDEVT